MKYALFTTQFILPVEDEEQAALIAMSAEKSSELNIASALEQNDLTRGEAAEGGFRMLGTAVSVFDELPVLS